MNFFKSFMAVLAACALTLTFIACNKVSDEEQIRAVLETYYQADVDLDVAKMKSCCTPKMQMLVTEGERRIKNLSPADRKEYMRIMSEFAKNRTIKTVKVDGESATADIETFAFNRRDKATVNLKKIQGKWLLDGFSISL